MGLDSRENSISAKIKNKIIIINYSKRTKKNQLILTMNVKN